MLEMLQRSEVSNPPAYGAKIASNILADDDLREAWFADLITMSDRIRSMRRALYEHLVSSGKRNRDIFKIITEITRCTWVLGSSHSSIGHVWIFGTVSKHCARASWLVMAIQSLLLILMASPEKYHIYMAENSRISIAGLNEDNVAYVGRSITECLQKDC